MSESGLISSAGHSIRADQASDVIVAKGWEHVPIYPLLIQGRETHTTHKGTFMGNRIHLQFSLLSLYNSPTSTQYSCQACPHTWIHLNSLYSVRLVALAPQRLRWETGQGGMRR